MANNNKYEEDYNLQIEASLSHLEQDLDEIKSMTQKILKAFDGAFYPLDFLALAAVNRTLYLEQRSVMQ